MRLIKIAVYDQSPVDLAQTVALLMKYSRFPFCSLTTFSDSAALLKTKRDYDMVLLEIGTQSPNGYEVACQLHSKEGGPLIIFLTRTPDYVYQGYGLAFRYLLKPVMQAQIDQVLDEAIESLQHDCCFVDQRNISYLLRLREIYYIETSGHLTKIYMSNEKYMSWHAKCDILKRLPQSVFAQPYKGYWVNLGKVQSISPTSVTLLNQTTLPLSRRSAKAFEAKLREYYRMSE